MDSVLAGLLVITLLVIAMFVAGQAYISLQSSALDAWRETEARVMDRARTDISISQTETQGGGGLLDVVVVNDGKTRLTDYDRWDVIVDYTTSGSDVVVDCAEYGGPGDISWWVEGIYVDADTSTAEVLEPNLFNPGEEMVIQVWLSPTVGLTTTNSVSVVTPNGIAATQVFTY